MIEPDVNNVNLDEDGDGESVGQANTDVNEAPVTEAEEEDDEVKVHSVSIRCVNNVTDVTVHTHVYGIKRIVLPGQLSTKKIASLILSVKEW